MSTILVSESRDDSLQEGLAEETPGAFSGLLKRAGQAWRGGSVGTAAISYAGFGRRLAAYLIDHAILVTFNVIMLVVFVVAMTVLSEDFSIRALMLHEILGASVGAWVWSVVEPAVVTAYFILHWRAFGATPGQWLFDVQVVTMDLRELSLGHAFLRWVGFIFCTLTAGLGFIWSLFDPYQQGIHDKFGRTIVVRRSELEELKLLAEAESELIEEELEQLENEVST